MATNTMNVHLKFKWWVNPLIKIYQLGARLGFNVDSDSLVKRIRQGTLINGRKLDA